MGSLNYISTSKLNILASKLPNKSSSPSPPLPPLNAASSLKPQQRQNKKQPTVIEIERAIGAGIYREKEPKGESKENDSLFDTIFEKTIGKTEGPMEKQLREIGERINDNTEKKLRSAGKPILMFMYVWILPMWILAFCIASGIIKLPFHNAFLDDLLM